MLEIIPGIFEKDWSQIETKVKLVAAHVDWVQIDLADNTLVPTASFLELVKLNPLIKAHPKLSWELHLMVENPQKYIKAAADAGFKRVVAQIECSDPRRFLEEARFESVEVGLAIDSPTPFEQVEPFLEEIDVVLVMTVEAGESDQPFMPDNLEKIKTIRRNLPDLPIEVDGGINPQTAKLVVEAGANRLVSTSFIFKDLAQVAAAIEALKSA